ncbi:MAG: hypothetical protein IJZ29_00560 [Clostridia bacterium]|nr:hypothetical protein [Clostridia bacterium]
MEEFREEQPRQENENLMQVECGGDTCISSSSCADGSSFGKFKTADALVNAYNNLQAEFTRRCQRIKSLEKQLEESGQKVAGFDSLKIGQENLMPNDNNQNQVLNSDANKINAEEMQENAINNDDSLTQNLVDLNCNNTQQIVKSSILDDNQEQILQNEEMFNQVESDAERLSEVAHNINKKYDTASNEVPSYLKEDFKAELTNFLSENKDAKQYAKEIGEEMIKDKSLSLKSAYERVLAKKYKAPSELAKDDEFIKNYILSNDAVIKSIIRTYKQEEKQLPTMISNNNGNIAQAYPSQVRTIKEAGELAYKLFS